LDGFEALPHVMLGLSHVLTVVYSPVSGKPGDAVLVVDSREHWARSHKDLM
jgi:hypothetical protein